MSGRRRLFHRKPGEPHLNCLKGCLIAYTKTVPLPATCRTKGIYAVKGLLIRPFVGQDQSQSALSMVPVNAGMYRYHIEHLVCGAGGRTDI